MAEQRNRAIAAVIFDLDGVLVDSETVWNDARQEVAQAHGGQWPSDAQRAMMGMSSTEWSAYMHDALGVTLAPEEISSNVVARLEEIYRRRLPLIQGAREAVVALAEEWPLALASSANREIIELVLELAGLGACFGATVSSEEVARGKPAPDVYLEAARRLGSEPMRCAAVEDSGNGLFSAAAAGMTVFAVPNPDFPPGEEALAVADDVLDSIAELTAERVRRISPRRARA
jgi:HAD superfamily hydrolase (TIGR01509 family)